MVSESLKVGTDVNLLAV